MIVYLIEKRKRNEKTLTTNIGGFAMEGTVYEHLMGRKIVNVKEGRPDGSILVVFEGSYELVVVEGALRNIATCTHDDPQFVCEDSILIDPI